jgi:hypothetical protein
MVSIVPFALEFIKSLAVVGKITSSVYQRFRGVRRGRGAKFMVCEGESKFWWRVTDERAFSSSSMGRRPMATPDQPTRAYLRVIASDPEGVKRALAKTVGL